jgi:hypothetical protein
MLFDYQVYGLSLCADRAIPGLACRPAKAANSWFIRVGALPDETDDSEATEPDCLYVSSRRSEAGAPSWKIWRQAENNFLRFRFYDGTDFVIDHLGKNIWASWPESLTVEDTATYLLGPVLGFVLRLTGTICLHASAVAIGARAVAFAGPPGAGKSTAAAAFAKLGLAVLSDDIVALSEHAGYYWVEPGYPRVNLWPDSAGALFGADGALPLVTPNWDKSYLDLNADGRRFQAEPLPLAALYFLAPRTSGAGAPLIDGLPASRALIELVGNSYANHLLDKQRRAQEFKRLGRLARTVTPRRLVPSSDPGRLPDLCRAIVDDMQPRLPPRVQRGHLSDHESL